MKMKCVECESPTKRLFRDPRNPPVDEFDCLCFKCWEDAMLDEIAECESDLEEYRNEVKKARKREKAKSKRRSR